jgi:hypothetical protein
MLPEGANSAMERVFGSPSLWERLISRRRQFVFVAIIVSFGLSIYTTYRHHFSRKPTVIAIKPLNSRHWSTDSDVSTELFPDPVSLAKSANPSDPALNAWLDRWLNEYASGKKVSDKERDDLWSLLSVTPLSSCRLLAVSSAFHKLSNDTATSAVFYSSAQNIVHTELNDPTCSREMAIRIVKQIKAIHKDYKDVMWDRFMNHGEPQRNDDMLSLYKDFIDHCPSDSSELYDTLQSVRIGYAESLLQKGRQNEAIACAESIDRKSLTHGQLCQLSWTYGLALWGMHRAAEAKAQFQFVEQQEDSKFSVPAGAMLVELVADTGDRIAANRALDDYIRRQHPSADQVVPLLAKLQSMSAQ